MTISVVIPTRDRPAYLEQCLEALDRARDVAPEARVEVMVVDDGSEGAAARRNRSTCARRNARYHGLERSRGMSVARAEGVAATHGNWIAFLDDDVVVERDWLERLGQRLARCGEEVVGLEGWVIPSGDGVWDREVQNRSGGLFLTCHIVYRRSVLDAAGGFDTHFEHEGPYHEDHELAARMLQLGAIVFVPELRAVHLPRSVNLPAYLASAPRRISQLLNAELYFYLKQRERYHLFRHEGTFWRTYRAVVTRHLYTTLHRRAVGPMIRHPLQSLVLTAATAIEQLCAPILFPRLARRFLTDTPGDFAAHVDAAGSRARWGGTALRRLRRDWLSLARFILSRRPVYNTMPLVLKAAGASADRSRPRLYLRVDDVFFSEGEAVDSFLTTMEGLGVPYLAAVTGNDLRDPRAGEIVRRIRSSGGAVGLHGFSHEGRFGPFASEILQMTIPELRRRLEEQRALESRLAVKPAAFVAPFNAINALQIRFMATRFAVVCGGPETARFTDRILGPVALDGGGVYFPSYYPFYGSSTVIRRQVAQAANRLTGAVCLTVHMPEESAGGCEGLKELVRSVAHLLGSWDAIGGRVP